MKAFLKLTTAAAALAGSAAFCAPASAAYIGVGVGPIGFDMYSGGYCDRWGCPNDYWSYPIYYGPVYYGSTWYRGPVYTRVVDGERWYWIHGAWHRDQWRGARPSWARITHYGPPLGLDYYREHGFRVNDRDWRSWQGRDDRYRTEYRDEDRGGYYGNEDRDRYRDYDANSDRYDYDRDRYQDMDQDRGYGDYDRDRGTYEHSGYGDRDQSGQRAYNGSGYDRDRTYNRSDNDRDYDRDNDRDSWQRSGYEHSGYDRDNDRNGYQRPAYDRDRDSSQHSGYQHSSYYDRDSGRSGDERSGGATSSGAWHTSHTSHHITHHTRSHHSSQPSDRDDSGYHHTGYTPGGTHAYDSTGDRGNSGSGDGGGSGTENGYQHTNYQQQPGERGHAKAPPPKNSRNSQTTPDEDNGPSH